jgi:RimJ/RimL family protein N-acetyltransferase
MEPRTYDPNNGCVLLIREAAADDARALLESIEASSGESDFLSFGPGEFELSDAEEEAFLRKCREADNHLYILGLIEERIVATLVFSGGRRPRIRHAGDLSMSGRQQYWGLGMGSLMLDTLIVWARETPIVKKIDVRVRTDNHRAIRLYERKGFVTEGRLRKAILLGGRYFDHHWMGLEL